ncbi:MAG: TetR/AcrR family transcriptional regulator [Lachnospiraceae bacterium]|jgi:AcrR family transcriptional regulator
MGKAALNKQFKRTSLLEHAYALFTKKGFNKTTISDIVRESGLAKGTFYLYFKDKYDLRDQLVAKMSSQILLEAEKAIDDSTPRPGTVEEYLFAFVDFILYHLQQNKMQLNFISKNLSWGVFEHAFEMADESDANNFNKIYQNFLAALQENHYQCDTPELLLFTIIELVNSTGYNTIMYETPCTLEQYLPYLHRCIHSILESYRVQLPAEIRPDTNPA